MSRCPQCTIEVESYTMTFGTRDARPGDPGYSPTYVTQTRDIGGDLLILYPCRHVERGEEARALYIEIETAMAPRREEAVTALAATVDRKIRERVGDTTVLRTYADEATGTRFTYTRKDGWT